jgi:hypothetical protein
MTETKTAATATDSAAPSVKPRLKTRYVDEI